MSSREYYYKHFRGQFQEFWNKIPHGEAFRWASLHKSNELDELSHISKEDLPFFLSALACDILIDQVMYTHFQAVYPEFNKMTKYPKMTTAWINANPWIIFDQRAMLSWGLSTNQVLEKFKEFAEIFIKDLEKFFRKNELKEVTWEKVREAMLNDFDVRRGKFGEAFINELRCKVKFINRLVAKKIAEIIYGVDKRCRIDLHNKFIAHEDNYTASFTTRLYDVFQAKGLTGSSYCLGRVLTKREERYFGCDGVFVFRCGDNFKIGLFEAKWPRFNIKPNNSLDKMPAKKLGKHLSHFSDQLRRQNSLLGVAIWEMLYDNRRPGNVSGSYDKYGSSCIWHNEAYNYYKKNITQNAWKDRDIDKIKKINIYKVVESILSCKHGQIFNQKDGKIKISNSEKDDVAEIPIPSEKGGACSERIIDFMKKHGLNSYFYIDLCDEKFLEK
ncbi:hypothetical protein L6267_03715 [Candidatus Parcubacteria bacterium]|nr:hypothetical protein [Candidatus Parcubacteria bacterium]